MKKVSDVFKSIRFAKLDPKHDKGPATSTDDEEHGAVSSQEFAQQLAHVKKRSMQEEKKMKGEDPCWTGYEMVGMKDKNGKKVPNCVPVSEAKDESEYGYEGDMALNQLATLTRCAEMIKDMLKPDTDMPEWVQSKITLATDYIQTAADYMYSEMKEEVELTEGRPSQRHPLEGHEYHKKTNAELEYIAKDAHKAAEAMKSHNTTAENKYRDQANDSATVRYFRQKNGMPDWYKKKYGHMNESDAYEKDVKPSDKPHDKEAAAKRAKIAAVMARRKMAKEEVEQIDELSNDTLGRYKKAAGADASKADKAGDYAKGNKRFSGIVKATRKQFDNDAKKQPLKESRKAEIIKDASKSAKEKAAKTKDKFEADPILSSEIVKEDK